MATLEQVATFNEDVRRLRLALRNLIDYDGINKDRTVIGSNVTVKVFTATPAAKLNVPETGVKSVPATALPDVVV